jgi:3alpha(or 20beta)-hydroxysteroid dehydrogenase
MAYPVGNRRYDVGSKLDGKVAFITGAARGQGEAIARVFVDAGARVVVADVLVAEGERLARQLGPAARFEHLDVTSADAWCLAVSRTVDAFGHLDVLVNNAGVFALGTVEDTSLEDYTRIITVNQIGCYLGMRAVIAPMRTAGGGSIINTSSAAALSGTPGLFAYGASKWAIRGMTKTAALELGAHGIRVNVILPGSIDTEMVRPLQRPERAAFFQTLAVPRQGTVDDIAPLALYLASDDSAYCTGADFVVDGGISVGTALPPRRG